MKTYFEKNIRPDNRKRMQKTKRALDNKFVAVCQKDKKSFREKVNYYMEQLDN